jgi:hypothetical protein
MEVQRTVCVTGDRAQALTHMGTLRLMRADLVVQTGGDERLRTELAAVSGAAVIRCRLRTEPAEPIPADARVALFTTSEDATLGDGSEPLVSSPNLARRAELGLDLDRAASEGCDTYVTEVKAAGIDMVAAEAARRGARTILCGNRPEPFDGEQDLADALLRLATA